MGKIIIANAIVRKPNHLYYIDGAGNVCETEMKHGKKKGESKKEEPKKKENVGKKDGKR